MNDSTEAGMKCPLSGCPVKHVLLAAVVVFLLTYAFDFLFHGMFMKPYYEATASLWRPEAEMQSMMGFCLLYHGVLAIAVAGLYCMVGKSSECQGKCPKMGVKFGILLGLVLGISDFSSYMWLPLTSTEIPMLWLIGRLVWGVVIGIALAYTCRCMKKNCTV